MGSGVGVGMGVGTGVGKGAGVAETTAKAGSVSSQAQEERLKQNKITAAQHMVFKYIWHFFNVRLLSDKLFPYTTQAFSLYNVS